MRWSVWLSTIFMAAFLPSCGTKDSVTPEQAPSDFPARIVAVPAGDFDGLAWLDDDQLIAGTAGVYPASSDPRLFVIGLNGRETRVRLPEDAGCFRDEYIEPRLLPGGDIGAVKLCFPAGLPLPPQGSLVTVDVTSKTVRPLVSRNPVLFQSGKEEFPISDFTVSPGLNLAVVRAGVAFCGALAWVTAHEVEPLRVELNGPVGPWELGQALRKNGECSSLGQAESPAWSPDGGTLAFFASPESANFGFYDRGKAPFGLYFLAGREGKPELVLSHVTGVSDLAWSPDSRWLVFSADVSGKGRGTWAVSKTSRQVVRISDALLRSFSWSLDGKRIAALKPEVPGAGPPASSIITIDMAVLTQP
ncbi:MAG: hypothetical protein WD276_05225 [Actinomycetota bacterium]